MLNLVWVVLGLASLAITGQATQQQSSMGHTYQGELITTDIVHAGGCQDAPDISRTSSHQKCHSQWQLAHPRKRQRSWLPKRGNKPMRRAYTTILAPPKTFKASSTSTSTTQTRTSANADVGYTPFPTSSQTSAPLPAIPTSVSVAQPSSFITPTSNNSTNSTANTTNTTVSDNPVVTPDGNGFQDTSQTVDAQFANKNLGITVGAAIGGVAVLGLASLFIYHKAQRHGNRNQPTEPVEKHFPGENAQTRWRTLSFMDALSGAVSQLRRSPSSSSKASSTLSVFRRPLRQPSTTRSWNEKDTTPLTHAVAALPIQPPPLSHHKD